MKNSLFRAGPALRNEDDALREKSADAMGFVTGVDEHHIFV